MAGSRHSQADQDALNEAHDALVRAGAVCTPPAAEGKSQALRTLKTLRPALKAIMPADDYADLYAAAGEAMDVQQAAIVLSGVMNLIQSEAWEADDDSSAVLQQLVTIARGLMAFISGELDEVVSLSQSPEAAPSAPAPSPAPDAPAILSAAKAFGSAVKAVGYTLRGYGVVFGGADLYGDTFTKHTDFGLTRSPIGMPVYYDHTLGGIKSQIGTVTAWQPDDEGIRVEVELDRHHKYVNEVLALAEKHALGFSTGALNHTVLRANGELKRWITGELSLTPIPAEPRTLGVAAKHRATREPEAAPEARTRGDAAATVTTIRII